MKVKELFETEERSVLSLMGKLEDPYRGSLDLSNMQLTSLVGSPKIIDGMVRCSSNQLRTLLGGPTDVSEQFSCYGNLLKTLKGAPEFIGGFFNCEDNKIVSLDGAPEFIGGVFYCGDNFLTSLKGIHKQIKHIGRFGVFENNPVKSHVLGVLKINALKEIFLDNKHVQDIMNKHLKGNRDIFACQEELINAGFPEYAQP